jgi:type 2 lantibiotic biosynthesis protein LanM
MLLPRRFLQNPESDGVDISGLAYKGGQLTPFGLPTWEAGSTDEMRLVRKQVPMGDDGNTPTLNGAHVELLNYVEAIVSGFNCIYQVFQNHRDELLSDQSPLSRFADDEIRVVLRSTHTYAALLRESCHPDLLQDALDKDRLLDRLWAHINVLPYSQRLIATERADMHRGDVPMFTTTPNSLHLWSAPDNRLSDVLAENGMTMVQRRIRQLDEGDRARQVWFIGASLATTDTGFGRVRRRIAYESTTPPVATREALVEASRAVGDRLEALAIRGADDASWVGLTFRNERSVTLMPLGADLYDGLPGVALFLAYLGAITEAQRYTDLAKAAVTSLRREIVLSQAGKRPPIAHIGAFTGWGGLIYTFTHLGVLWGQCLLINEAQSLVELIAAKIEETTELDIVDGLAGCIAGLLTLHRAAPLSRTLSVAVACGDRLRAGIQDPDYEVLTGLSHGMAGMALALLELASVSGEERFRISALELIGAERRYFNPEQGNWPDMRDRTELGVANNEGIYQVIWCHGAPGIGLARLRSLEYLDDSQIRDEIRVALTTTLARGFGGNHSLCHGDLGNLELLTEASRRFGDPGLQNEARRIAAFTLESIRRNGWISGVPLGVENPGLMSGLAGIGYGLLRLVDPSRVPSVLTLQ